MFSSLSASKRMRVFLSVYCVSAFIWVVAFYEVKEIKIFMSLSSRVGVYFYDTT
jgi:hypothetical protein